MFLKQGVVRGTSIAVDNTIPPSRKQEYIDAIVQIKYEHKVFFCDFLGVYSTHLDNVIYIRVAEC